jgi:phage terminase large subunit
MAELKLEDVSKLVNEYITAYEHGFTEKELKIILSTYDNIDKEAFYKAMYGNTCMMIDGHTINYHCDVITALKCGIEKREIRPEEWD